MKRHIYFTIILLVPVTFLLASSLLNGPLDFENLDRQLWAVISDTNSAPEDVKKAIEHLGDIKQGEMKRWRDIADNSAYLPIHKQLCIMALFKRHSQLRGSVADLALLLDKPKWLQDDDISKIGVLSGTIPIKNIAAGDVFVISILPNSTKRITSIYVQVAGEMNISDFRKLIRFGISTKVKNRVIIDYGYFEWP